MANTLKFGGGTWARKKGSTLAYNDEDNNFKPLPFSFERNSIATRVNKEGLIEVVSNDVPRIDYTDSSEGVLLLEPSRTNLLPYSEDFSNAAWSKSGATITDSSFTSPDGTLNASTLTTSVSGGTVQKTLSVSDGDVTFSVFVKKGTTDGVRLRIDAATDCNGYFNLVTNSIHSSSDDAKIENYRNGWYKVSISADITSFVKASIYTTDGTTNYENGTLHLYGAQLEQGYLTSYIPTNSSTVQRAAETCNGSGNSEVFNDSQGVLFANIAALSDDGTSRQISLNNGGTNNRVYFEYSSVSNRIRAVIENSLGNQAILSYIVSDVAETNKLAVKYKENDFALWVNGIEVDADDNGSILVGLNKLSFDRGDALSDFYGKTKEIAYYDEILTDLELETLTSYRSLNEMVTELNLNAL